MLLFAIVELWRGTKLNFAIDSPVELCICCAIFVVFVVVLTLGRAGCECKMGSQTVDDNVVHDTPLTALRIPLVGNFVEEA